MNYVEIWAVMCSKIENPGKWPGRSRVNKFYTGRNYHIPNHVKGLNPWIRCPIIIIYPFRDLLTCINAWKLMEHNRKLDLGHFRSNFCADLRPKKKNYFFRSMDRSINRCITEIIYNGNLPSHWGLVPCLNPPFCLFKTD